jgi:hypothetical protein
MHFTTVLALLLTAVSASPIIEARAGQAILQFEIAPDTFTSNTPIAIPGTLNKDQKLVGATIATTSGVSNPAKISCQAFNGDQKVGSPFTTNTFVRFNGGKAVQTTKITCK